MTNLDKLLAWQRRKNQDRMVNISFDAKAVNITVTDYGDPKAKNTRSQSASVNGPTIEKAAGKALKVVKLL